MAVATAGKTHGAGSALAPGRTYRGAQRGNRTGMDQPTRTWDGATASSTGSWSRSSRMMECAIKKSQEKPGRRRPYG